MKALSKDPRAPPSVDGGAATRSCSAATARSATAARCEQATAPPIPLQKVKRPGTGPVLASRSRASTAARQRWTSATTATAAAAAPSCSPAARNAQDASPHGAAAPSTPARRATKGADQRHRRRRAGGADRTTSGPSRPSARARRLARLEHDLDDDTDGDLRHRRLRQAPATEALARASARNALLVGDAAGRGGDLAARLLLGAVGIGVAGDRGRHPAAGGDHGGEADGDAARSRLRSACATSRRCRRTRRLSPAAQVALPAATASGAERGQRAGPGVQPAQPAGHQRDRRRGTPRNGGKLYGAAVLPYPRPSPGYAGRRCNFHCLRGASRCRRRGRCWRGRRRAPRRREPAARPAPVPQGQRAVGARPDRRRGWATP